MEFALASLVEPRAQPVVGQIRIHEPAGERSLGERATIGGEGADVVVPGVDAVAWIIERRKGEWIATPQTGSMSPRELRKYDALNVGDAQLSVTDVSRTRLMLDVHHLVGNATIAPVTEIAALNLEGGDEDLEIRASAVSLPGIPAAKRAAVTSAAPLRPLLSKRAWAWVLAVPLVILLLVGSGLLIKERIEQARIELAKRPGQLKIDTGGVAASVSIDGVETGRAPGKLDVPAGSHTLTLRAPHYLDFVTTLNIRGAGQSQTLKAALQPSWGKVSVKANPAVARVTVDGRDSGGVPALVEVPSGVHHVQVIAPGLKPWESSVVVKAGETLAVGPITLGQPDANLSLRSSPAGAEVSVGGTFRGRTPLSIELPPGVAYDVVATLPGYETWKQSVTAEPGKSIALEARLAQVSASVAVSGEPAGADLLVDGKPRGKTPQTLNLSAIEHRIEVRKEGFLPFATTVQPAKGLERAIDYRLTSTDRAAALQDSAPLIKTKDGYVLKLIPGGTFTLGSERREQGRRPNETARQVTLKRPFYLGTHEITNIEFRKFRAGHVSGYVAKTTLDLDNQPVSQVSWDDAAEYCNWLSEREGLPPAYERQGGKFQLKRPVTTGYRLPTEAEWEYAARRAGADQMLRFTWGNTPPVPEGAGNFAGAEATRLVEQELPGYRDDYAAAAPVGKFKPNAFGLYDMAGNLSEWVSDFYLSFVDSSAATDPLGPEQSGRHVIRGSNWKSTSVSELRLAWRDSADNADQTIGFRIARYAE
jgi:formylglycine-generating enzyme required for sulfatase activity